ncbi:MAG: hypothetical protein HQL26_10395 [Candidatus Omnitrophica bacterium]|nr:hypothetical protein [Candidatus Omnitrophota bacterium]
MNKNLLNRKPKTKKRPSLGQVMLELAVFAAVVLFVMGMIIKQSMDAKYALSGGLQALRTTLRLSYLESKGKGTNGGGKDGNKSRNNATVTLVEDRLDAASGKMDSKDRAPRMSQAAGTASINLFLPTDNGETFNDPVQDFYINDQHFVLSTGKMEKKSPVSVWERIMNGDKDYWDASKGERFYPYRDGQKQIPPQLWKNFEWQWLKLSAGSVSTKKGKHTSVDIDNDLKEETVIGNTGGSWWVQDDQDGDIDMTYDKWDGYVYSECYGIDVDGYEFVKSETPADLPSGACGTTRWRSGMVNNAKFRSQQADGTYLWIEEGQLYAKDPKSSVYSTQQFSRSVRGKNQVDLIERQIRLAKYNPEILKRNRGITKCSSGPACCENIDGNCVYTGTGAGKYETVIMPGGKARQGRYLPVMYIRSAISDTRGRKWITDISNKNADKVFGP